MHQYSDTNGCNAEKKSSKEEIQKLISALLLIVLA